MHDRRWCLSDTNVHEMFTPCLCCCSDGRRDRSKVNFIKQLFLRGTRVTYTKQLNERASAFYLTGESVGIKRITDNSEYIPKEVFVPSLYGLKLLPCTLFAVTLESTTKIARSARDENLFRHGEIKQISE